MEKECASVTEVAEGPSICNPVEEPAEHLASVIQEVASFGWKVWVERPYEQILDATRRELEEQGFGVAVEIDVRRSLQDKLEVSFPRYTILGALNPYMAHQALELDRSTGLFLPWNVIIYEEGDGTAVQITDPIALFNLAGDGELQDLARSIKTRLQDVIDHVAAER